MSSKFADLFHYTLLRADHEPILQLVLGEVDLWQRILVLYLTYGLFKMFLSDTHTCVLNRQGWKREKGTKMRRMS